MFQVFQSMLMMKGDRIPVLRENMPVYRSNFVVDSVNAGTLMVDFLLSAAAS